MLHINKVFEDCDFNTKVRNKILNNYNQRLAAAYEKMLVEMTNLIWGGKPLKKVKETETEKEIEKKKEHETASIGINRNGTGLTLKGVPVKVKDKEGILKNTPLYSAFLEITGRCGGYCGAAKKAAQADFIVHALQTAQKKYELDLTPTVVRAASKKVLRTRSISKEKAALFSTQGRTSKQISPLIYDATPLDQHIQQMQEEINQFEDYCTKARIFYTNQWYINWNEQVEQQRNLKRLTL